MDAIPVLNNAIKTAMDVGDNASRELFQNILVDEDQHVDWLEGQLHVIAEIGLDNYLTQQIHKGGQA